MLDVLRRETNGSLNPTGKVSSERQWMARATERSARSEAAKQYRKKRGTERRREKKRGRDRPSKCDDCRDTGRADWPGQMSSGPSMAPPRQQPWATAICLPPFFSRPMSRPPPKRPRATAAPPVTPRGREPPDGGKGGAVLGRDGTTPQRQPCPRRIQCRSPSSASRIKDERKCRL